MKQGTAAERVACDHIRLCATGKEREKKRESALDTPAMLNHKRLTR